MYRTVFTIALLGVCICFASAQRLAIHDGELKGLIRGTNFGGTTISHELYQAEGVIYATNGIKQTWGNRQFQCNEDGVEWTKTTSTYPEGFKHACSIITPQGEIQVLYKTTQGSEEEYAYDVFLYREGNDPVILEKNVTYTRMTQTNIAARHYFHSIVGDPDHMLISTTKPAGNTIMNTSLYPGEMYIVNTRTLVAAPLGLLDALKRRKIERLYLGSLFVMAGRSDDEIVAAFYASRETPEAEIRQEVLVYDMNVEEATLHAFGTPLNAPEGHMSTRLVLNNGKLAYTGVYKPKSKKKKTKSREYKIYNGSYVTPEDMFVDDRPINVSRELPIERGEYITRLTPLVSVWSPSLQVYYLNYIKEKTGTNEAGGTTVIKRIMKAIGLLIINERGEQIWIDRIDLHFPAGVPLDYIPQAALVAGNKIHLLQNTKAGIKVNLIDSNGKITQKLLNEDYDLVPGPCLKVNDKEWKLLVNKKKSAWLATFKAE